MAYSQRGISNYYDDNRAHFSSLGSGYTFFTSESPDLENIRRNSTTEGSTTLVTRSGDSFRSKPLNSSVHQPPDQSNWYHVIDPSLYMVNMTISAMVDQQKSDQAVQYSEGAICISSNGGRLDYTPGTLMDYGAYYGDWDHDIGWGTRPTAYFKSSPGTTLKNKQSQILFPRIPSPRWFRRAAIQPVTTSDNTRIYFFILTDVLSRFYIYPAHLSKIAEKDSDIIQRDDTTDWIIINNYQVHDIDFGDAIEPKIADFHGSEIPQHKYYDKYNESLSVFYGDYSKCPSAKDADEDFDSYMGTEDPYKDKNNLTPFQYLWRFNFNGTKATTIAFQRGEALKAKNIKGEKSEFYKHKGGSFAFPEDYKDAFGGASGSSEASIEPAPKLKEVPVEKVYEYYPVLLEVELKIEVSGASFTSAVVTSVSKSAKTTKEWYVASGYTHPYLDPKTNKYISGDIPEEQISETETIGGYPANELVYLTLDCYGNTVNYESDEKPYDVFFESLKDSKYKDDIPSIVKSDDNTHIIKFIEMLISGKYDKEVIKGVIDKVTNIQTFKTYVKTFIKSKFQTVAGFPDSIEKDRAKNFTQSKTYSSSSNPLIYKFYECLSASTRLSNLIKFFIKQNTVHELVDEHQAILDVTSDGSAFALYYNANLWSYQAFPDSETSEVSPTENYGTYPSVINKWAGSIKYDKEIYAKLEPLLRYNKTSSTGWNLNLYNSVFSVIFSIIDFSFRTSFNPILVYGYYIEKKNPCFMSLLREYLKGFQVLDLYYNVNETTLNLMFGWYIFEYIVDESNFGSAEKNFIKEVVAQGFLLEYKDITLQKTSGDTKSYKDTFLYMLPIHCCQVIDGMLVPNSIMFSYPPRDDPKKDPPSTEKFKTSLGTGTASKPDWKTPRAYHISYLPDFKKDIYLLQEFGTTLFGKKIHNFKAVLTLKTLNKTVLNEFILIDSPYVAIQPTPFNVATFPILPFKKGDEKPFSSRALLWNKYIFKSAFSELKEYYPKGYNRPQYERYQGPFLSGDIRSIIGTDPTQSSSITSRVITTTPPPDPTQPLPLPTPNGYTMTVEYHLTPATPGVYTGVAGNSGPGSYYNEIHTTTTNLPDGSISKEVLTVKIPTEYSVFSSSLYRMPGNGIDSNKTHTNGVIFGLFIKTNSTTRTYNLSAVDLASRSFIFQGSTANYHYKKSHKVGTFLYLNGKSHKSNGECKAPHDFKVGEDSKLLDITNFNMIYSLVASNNFVDDIPQNQSLYSSGNLLYNSTQGDNSKIDPSQMVPDNYHVLPNESVKVIRSTISSHPNGSVAAYSLPPYGFLKSIYIDPSRPKTDRLGGYTSEFTIDLIRAYKPPVNIASTEAKDKFPTFIETTHKEQYNSAFTTNGNTSKRTYSNYTTDPRTKEALEAEEKNVYLGGFCTAGVWYDFALPKEYTWLIPPTS